MARFKEFDETDAIMAAMRSFWARGYDGTSLHDLELSMKLTRTSIYNAFGNKRHLFDTVIAYYQQTLLAELYAYLNKSDNIHDNINNLLKGVINIHFRKDSPGGCLVILSILERAQHDEQTILLLEKPFKTLHKFIQKKLKEAQHRSELNSNLDTNIVATMIVTIITGILVMGKAGFSKTQLSNTANMISQLLQK